MNDFAENEKIEITDTEGNMGDFSTVFSDPEEHRDVPQKKKRRLLAAIASVLSVAILAGGTVAVVKLIPEKEESIESPFASDIIVSEKSSADFSSLTLKNKNGIIELYTVKEKTGNSDSSSETEETVNWYLKGVSKDLVSTSTVAYLVDGAVSINAIREITEKTAKECGLENPTITFEATDKDSKKFSVAVGTQSPDNSGYYIKTSISNKIYLVDTSYVENLQVDKLYFASTDSMTAFKAPDDADDYMLDGTLTYFDSLTVDSKKFSDTLMIEYLPDDSEISKYAGYIVRKPTYRIAQNAENMVAVFTGGLSVSGAYSYDVKPATLKKFGLDKPDFKMTISVKGKAMTYKFTLQDDGNYAAVNDDSKLVSMVSPDSVSSFIGCEIVDFYSSWICLYSIDDLKGLNIRAGEKNYNFGISALSEEETEQTDEKYAITLDGKAIDCQSFQNVYQHLISIACTDYTVDNLSVSPSVVFEFIFKDKENSVIKFTKASDTRYQYSVDGRELGKVTTASINKLIKYLEKLASGEIIGEVN